MLIAKESHLKIFVTVIYIIYQKNNNVFPLSSLRTMKDS